MICTGLHRANICDSLSSELVFNSRLYEWQECVLGRQLAYFTYDRAFVNLVDPFGLWCLFTSDHLYFLEISHKTTY